MMAIIKSGFISGKLGDRVYYEKNGKQCSRPLRTGIKISETIRKRSANFGIASRLAKVFRECFSAFIPYGKGQPISNRLCGALAKWLASNPIPDIPACESIPSLNKLNLDSGPGFFRHFTPACSATQTSEGLELNIDSFIPTQTLGSLRGMKTVLLEMKTIWMQVADQSDSGVHSSRIRFSYNNKPIEKQTISIPLLLKSGMLILTVARLKASKGKKFPKQEISALGIVDARYV